MRWCRRIGGATTIALSLVGAVAAAPAWERQLDMKSMADSARIIGELFGGRRPYMLVSTQN